MNGYRLLASVYLQYPDSGELEQAGGLKQGQAHDAGVAAVDALDETGGEALNGVSAGLIQGFTGGDIAPAFGRFEVPKPDVADAAATEAARVADGHRGVDLMTAPGEFLQHFNGMLRRFRFAEDQVVGDHAGIRAEHRQIASYPAAGQGLGPRQAFDEIEGRFIEAGGLIHGYFQQPVADTDLIQQLTAAR